jgi:hypothetical protein
MNTRLYLVPKLRMSGAKPPLYSRSSCLVQGYIGVHKPLQWNEGESEEATEGMTSSLNVPDQNWPIIFIFPFNRGALQSLSCDQRGPSRRIYLKIQLSTLSHLNSMAYLSFTCKTLNLCCMPHHFLHPQIKESRLEASKLRINWVQGFIYSEVKIKAGRSLPMCKILVGRIRGNGPPERPRHRCDNTL